ncbi:unnamed protein product [Rhizoctonia solani]|uniref:Uncharacterized protein n=1 Tax=Rhizoctonia solani TaxID=456999 RepID=A0A8H3HSW4_9AGAM|nr:unnamed protein product [Rhizoctonia solani]
MISADGTSRSYTPGSDLSTSSGSQSSCRRLDSNTTPSPSGGNRSPTFNPRILSNKLAMLEASQALAEASTTLSIAARAMSRAAASLATTGLNHRIGLNHIPEARETHAIDEEYKLAEADKITPVGEIIESQQERHTESESGANVHPSEPAPLTETQPSALQATVTQSLPEAPFSQSALIASSKTVYSAVERAPPTVPVKSETNSQSGSGMVTSSEPDARTSELYPAAPAPGLVTAAPHVPEKGVSESSSSSKPQPTGTKSGGNLGQVTPAETETLLNPTRIVLESGFDLLPALCHASKRRLKTVCLYNYSGLTAAISIAVMLRANTKIPVMVPDSTKKDKLTAAVNKFNSSQSGILLWPGCNKLQEITGLADSPNIQLIQLGQPIQTSAVTTCSNTTVILAKSDLSQPQAPPTQGYSVDPLSEVCNQQGPQSPLQPFRLWLRSRLSDDSYARGFYWDWFLLRRKRNPKESVIDAVKLANQYAEQFLLRGENKRYGEPIGGKVTLTNATVRAQKLELAVQMGILPVV